MCVTEEGSEREHEVEELEVFMVNFKRTTDNHYAIDRNRPELKVGRTIQAKRRLCIQPITCHLPILQTTVPGGAL